MIVENRFRKLNFLSTSQKEELIKKIRNYLSQKKDIVFAYIYGSFVNKRGFRDIDIALFMKEPIEAFELETDFSYELTTIIGYPVEVRIINNAPVSFQMAVLRMKEVVFSRDEGKHTDFIQDVGKRYIDYSHLREIAVR